MNKIKLLLFISCAALLLLVGCAKQQQFKTVERICVPNLQKQQAMEIAEDVLGQMHFTIEKADAELGVIRTRPLPGAQFFEFWRSDNIGAFNTAEANLHSIRRIVELNISLTPLPLARGKKGGQLCIDCDVQVQRLSLPEHEVSSSSRAYKMFSKSTSSVQKLEFTPEQKKDMAWVDLGKDSRLATKILKQIETCLTATVKKQITTQQKREMR